MKGDSKGKRERGRENWISTGVYTVVCLQFSQVILGSQVCNGSGSVVAVTLSGITQHCKLLSLLMLCQHRSSTGSFAQPTGLAA